MRGGRAPRRAAAAFALLLIGAQPAVARGPVHREGRWLVDGQGRVVVLHGFNVVRKNPPFVRREFGRSDARLLAREGFTVARIGFIWEGVEPRPGHYDDAYIARVLRLDRLLGRYGIRTMIEVHQDGWGRSGGLDGAPAWASLGANFNSSFAAFWRNDPGPGRVGIETRFIRAWRHVARAIGGDANVVAIDPFNEPYAGSDHPSCGLFARCPAFERGALARFNERVTRAIRAGGAEQPVFPEGIADSANTPPVLRKLPDRQSGFNFHFYCAQTQLSADVVRVGEPSAAAKACAPIERRNLGRYTRYAKRLDVPGFLSEFSCNDVDPDNAQVVDLMGRAFTSWTSWAYYTAADDPADCPGQGLLRDDDRPGSEANAKQAKLAALAVPYAEAIAGRPRSTSLNRPRRDFRLAYRSAPVPGAHLRAHAPTVVFVPERMYRHGYRVQVHGAHVRSKPGARRLLLTGPRHRSVRVTIRPRR